MGRDGIETLSVIVIYVTVCHIHVRILPCILVFWQYFEHEACQHLIAVEATTMCSNSLYNMLPLGFRFTTERAGLKPQTCVQNTLH